MFKMPKQTIQVCIDAEDMEYLQEIGVRYNKKNPSQAISALIRHSMALEKKVETITEAWKQKKPSYEDVRTEQIKKYDIDKDPKYDFLPGRG